MLIKHEVIEIKEGKGPWESLNHKSCFVSDADQECNLQQDNEVAFGNSLLTETNSDCPHSAVSAVTTVSSVDVEHDDYDKFSTVTPVAVADTTACEDTSATKVSAVFIYGCASDSGTEQVLRPPKPKPSHENDCQRSKEASTDTRVTLIDIAHERTTSERLDSSNANAAAVTSLTSFTCFADDNVSDWFDDPAAICNRRITPLIIDKMVRSNHVPADTVVFPVSGGRTCSRFWFYKTLPQGDKLLRKWLSYSTSMDSLFCIDCLLFAGPTASEVWARKGYHDWAHATRDIAIHECSRDHRDSEIARVTWIMKQSRLDDKFAHLTHLLVDRNRRVVYVSIKCLKYLASEMSAIRGHESHDGKFLHLFREFAEFDASAAAYLETLSGLQSREYSKKPEINLLSPLNIRRLLITMRDMVVNRIVANVRKSGLCSLISDGTQDESKLEAQCIILRYLEDTPAGVMPVERLIDIFTTGDTSGQVLSERILCILQEKHVSLQWLIGQSYDGAGNVRGKYTGLKTLVLEKAPKAMYVWCSAHRLNLVVEAVLKCCPDICNALGVLQELYVFFTGHKRHSVLVEMQSIASHAHTLKRVSDTTRSWRSAEDGVNTLIDCFAFIIGALEKLASTSQDTATTTTSTGLLCKLQDARCIMSVMFLQHVFRVTGPVSRLLQGTAADLSIVVTLIGDCIQTLTTLRRDVDQFYLTIKQEVTDFCNEHQIYPQLRSRRIRKKKRMAGEQADDESIADREQAYKTEVIIRSLDVILQQLNDRFSSENVDFLREMKFFTPANLLSSPEVTATDIQHLCKFYHVDSSAVAAELNAFAPVYKSLSHLIDVSDVSTACDRNVKAADGLATAPAPEVSVGESETRMTEHCTKRWEDHTFLKPLRALLELSSFTELQYLVKILATVAVTSCSAERIMSRVKIIKNRLRSTMSDDWFSALTILASERDIVDSLSVQDIIDNFALCSNKLRTALSR